MYMVSNHKYTTIFSSTDENINEIQTNLVSLVEQEMPTFPEYLTSSRFLTGFVLFDI
jgi:hypothetical protein